jgi:hypothetical protein
LVELFFLPATGLLDLVQLPPEPLLLSVVDRPDSLDVQNPEVLGLGAAVALGTALLVLDAPLGARLPKNVPALQRYDAVRPGRGVRLETDRASVSVALVENFGTAFWRRENEKDGYRRS